MLKSFEKGSNIFSGLCEQTNKVQCMYLAFENIKIATKKDQQGKKAEKKVRMMFLKIKMQEVSCCWWNYKLNWRNSTNNVYSRKQTTNNIPLHIFQTYLEFWKKEKM